MCALNVFDTTDMLRIRILLQLTDVQFLGSCYSTLMDFILITSSGKILTFYIRECALCYQALYGGTLINHLEPVLETT